MKVEIAQLNPQAVRENIASKTDTYLGQSVIIPIESEIMRMAQDELYRLLGSDSNFAGINGLTYQSVTGDGNCFYYAVAFYLGEDVSFLRSIIAANLEQNKEKYRPFIPLPNNRNLDDYIEDIRTTNAWAGDLELTVLMRLLDRPIVVIEGDRRRRNQNEITELNLSGEPIFVYYNGSNHYDALILNSEADGRIILDQLMSERSENRTTLGHEGFMTQERLHGTLIATICDVGTQAAFDHEMATRVQLERIYAFLQQNLSHRHIKTRIESVKVTERGNVTITFETITELPEKRQNAFSFFKENLVTPAYGAHNKYGNRKDFYPKLAVVIGCIRDVEHFNTVRDTVERALHNFARSLDTQPLCIDQLQLCNYVRRTLAPCDSITKNLINSRPSSPSLSEMRMCPKHTFFSVWLMPKEPDFTELRSRITKISYSYHSLPFDPHVTVFAGNIVSERALRDVVDNVARRFASITLKVNGVSATEARFRSLFFHFQDEPVLTGMSDTIRNELKSHSDYHLYPHLSLFYPNREQRVALAEKERLAIEESKTEPVALTFDRLETVLLPDKEDLSSWYTISSTPLAQRSGMHP